MDDDHPSGSARNTALVADHGLFGKSEQSTAAFGWSERLSPVAAGVIALFGVAMGIVALAFVCLVPWAFILSLGLFLAGPDVSVPSSPVWVALAALPPLVGMLLVLAWTIVGGTTADILTFGVRQGSWYLIQRISQPVTELPFAPVTGTPASTAKHLGRVQIGLDPVPAGVVR